MADETSTGKATFYRSPVEVLLPDAIELCARAEELVQCTPYKYQAEQQARSSVRAAILALALTIEGIANCCIERGAGLSKNLLDGALRLRTLDKLDLFLRIRGKTALDRGRIEVQRAAELIGRVRNSYVHPLIQEQSAEMRETGGVVTIAPDYSPEHAALAIPTSPRQWTVAHATVVLRATLDFMDHFLIDCCDEKPRAVGALLFDALNSDGTARPVSGPLYDACIILKKKWGVEPRCLSPVFADLRRRGVQFHV